MTNTGTATVTTLRIAAVESCDVLRIALRAHYGTDAEAMRYVILGDHETVLESFDSYQAANRWIVGYTRDASGWESISIYENTNEGRELVFEFYMGDVDAE